MKVPTPLFIVVGFLRYSASLARADTLVLSADPFGWDCSMNNDGGPGLRTVYVVQFTPGSFGARFKVELDADVTMTYLSEELAFPGIGNTQDGVALCYGSCVTGDGIVVVATMHYMFTSAEAACQFLRIVPHPDASTVDVINCYGVPEVAAVGDLRILTPGGACGCGETHTFEGTPAAFSCTPLPVEETTWGRVKAFYR
jgi:hypothetical protein